MYKLQLKSLKKLVKNGIHLISRRIITIFLVLIVLLTNLYVSAPFSFAQELLQLSPPGSLVGLSDPFVPPLLKGLKVYPDNPFKLDFILDKGEENSSSEQISTASTRLIKYFLASLTIPEKELWVNLSPYEKDRIIPEAFGFTEMGRDVLAQDYMLKQITASVLYPEEAIGKEFWRKVYIEAQKRFGTTDVPVDTFNKVWIVPQKAMVYENETAAYVVESRLKVLLEEDYLALGKSKTNGGVPEENRETNKIGSQVIREIVIPLLEKEVNEGKNFAQLRQIYHSLILALWFKDKVQASLFGQTYVDQGKVAGVDIADKTMKDKIWAQYVEAFKKGAYNYIKEDIDPVTEEMVSRQYFSGGAGLNLTRAAMVTTQDRTQLPQGVSDRAMIVAAHFDAVFDDAQKPLQEFEDLVMVNPKGDLSYGAPSALFAQSGVREIVGIRHGRTNANKFKILSGRSNHAYIDALDQDGQGSAQQAAKVLFERYKHEIVQGNVVVVTSSLRRAQQTAQPFLDIVKEDLGFDVEPVIDGNLDEINMGAAMHRPYVNPPKEFLAEMSDLGIDVSPMQGEVEAARIQIWPEDGGTGNAEVSFPNGESYSDLLRREYAFARSLNKYQGKIVLVFGHAIQISALRIILGSDPVLKADTNGNSILQWREMELKNAEIKVLASQHSVSAASVNVNKSEEDPATVLSKAKQTSMIKLIAVVGKTGSGKSTAVRYMQERGGGVVDPDDILRQPPLALRKLLIDAFGEGVIVTGPVETNMAVIFRNTINYDRYRKIAKPFYIAYIQKALLAAAVQNKKALFIDCAYVFDFDIDKDLDEVWYVKREDSERLGGLVERFLHRYQGEPDAMPRAQAIATKLFNDLALLQSEAVYEAKASLVINNHHSKETLQSLLDSEMERLARQHMSDSKKEKGDQAQTGGVNLSPARLNLGVKTSGSGISFAFDPALRQQLHKAAGLTPVIINIQSLTTTISQFFSLSD